MVAKPAHWRAHAPHLHLWGFCCARAHRFAWEALVINELAPLTLVFTAGDIVAPPIKGTLFLSVSVTQV
jgi:hypothetical protein